MHARKGSSDEPTASSGRAEHATARRGRSRPLPVAFVSCGARPRRARGARRGDRLGRRRASLRGEPSSRALAPRRSGRGGARRERRRAPHADRACVRRRTGRLASRSHSALAFAATDHRGEPRPGTRPRGRPYRRRGRSDASPRPRATRLRRRSVHLGLGRLLDRSPHGPDHRGDATAHAPRCPGDRDRRQRPERSARNLRSQRTARGEPADRVRGRFASDRSRRRGDELEILAALRGAPLGVVKCVTNDIRVPADSEWIIEGYLDAAGMTEPEGPYGEFLGYYGAVKKNPIFRVTAITRRRDALFQTSTIGGRSLGLTDTAQLNAIRTEVMVWRSLETAVREPLAVYATPSSGGAYNVRIALRQRVPGEARNAIAAAFSCLANVKHVFVVDPDIDVFSDEQIDWALATRFQGDRDLVVQSDMRAVPIDPSLEGARTTAKAGFDLTVPFGGRGIETMVPEPPTFEGKRFASVRAALEDGPKRFEELVAAIGSRDGREVVRELEALRAHAAIGRDAEGRYLLE